MWPIRHLVILISGGLLLATAANAVQYDRVDVSKSSIRFVPVLMVTKTDGSFGKFNAQIRFDPDKPAQSQAKVEIDLQSFDIGSDEATEEALGPNWFDVKHYPKATFVATQIKALGQDRFELAGNLTIRDQTRPINVPLTLTRDANGQGHLAGSLVIKRLDFGLGQGAWAGTSTVANEVTVQVRLSVSGR